jgi:thiol-disulfide isomerase/thioredoxin
MQAFRGKVRACGTAALTALALGAIPAGSAEPRPQAPPGALLLFVASWCAPCYGELRALPEIARAAGPLRTLVVPVDARRQTDRMVAGIPAERLLRLEPTKAMALMRAAAGTAPGLPTSAMTRPNGETCAVRRTPLTPATVAAMRAACALG